MAELACFDVYLSVPGDPFSAWVQRGVFAPYPAAAGEVAEAMLEAAGMPGYQWDRLEHVAPQRSVVLSTTGP